MSDFATKTDFVPVPEKKTYTAEVPTAVGTKVKVDIGNAGDASKFRRHTCMSFDCGSGEEKFRFSIDRETDAPVLTTPAETLDEGVVNLPSEDNDDIFKIEDDVFKWDITLAKPPKSNVLKWSIDFTDGVSFYYQDTLENDWKTSSERLVKGMLLEDYLDGRDRPDNVVGSYAVYSNKRGHYKKADGSTAVNYGIGKLCHIFRPLCTDSHGNEVWADLNIDSVEKTIEITIPEKFLATAVYPVTVDPDIGYTSTPGSYTAVNDRCFVLLDSDYTQAESNGETDSISLYGRKSSTNNASLYIGAYDDNSGPNALLQTQVYFYNITDTVQWWEKEYSGSSITGGSNYYPAWSSNANAAFGFRYYYDTGSSGDSAYWYGSTLPDPYSDETWTNSTELIGIYLSYTAAPGTNITATTGAVTIAGVKAAVNAGLNITATTGAVVIAGIKAALNTLATTGTLAIAGVKAAVNAGLNIAATTGTVVLAGIKAAVSVVQPAIVAKVGALTVAGVAATVVATTDVTAATGAVTISGQTASVDSATEIAATTGYIIINGPDAVVTVGQPAITATTGAVTIAGQSAVVLQYIPATTGAITIAGHAASVTAIGEIIGTTGAVTISGNAATITVDQPPIVATTGYITILGPDAVVNRGTGIACTTGAVTVAGQNSDISYVYGIAATTGTIVVAGPNATVTVVQPPIVATKGALTIAGPDATITVVQPAIVGTTGTVTVTGNAATVTVVQPPITATTGAVTVTGHNATRVVLISIDATTGVVTISGESAHISAAGSISATTAAVTVASNRATVDSTQYLFETLDLSEGADDIYEVIVKLKTNWATADSLERSITTLSDSATPSVIDGKNFATGGTTTITDLTGGEDGQKIRIIAGHSVTITDGTNIFLNGSSNFNMTATDTLTLICKNDKWYELRRGDNGA